MRYLGTVAALFVLTGLVKTVVAESVSLRIVTCNIGDLRGDPIPTEDVAEVLGAVPDPDVMVLQEVPSAESAGRLTELLGMREWLFRGYANKEKSGGVAILAQGSLSDPEMLCFASVPHTHGVLAARLYSRRASLLVASAHLPRIAAVEAGEEEAELTLREALPIIWKELVGDTIRSRSAEELLAWPKLREAGPIVIGGDFNTVPFSKTFRLLTRRFDDVLWLTPEFFKGTFVKTSLPVLPRIDYLFHSPSVECVEAYVWRRAVGDHRPVVGTFKVKVEEDPSVVRSLIDARRTRGTERNR